MTCKENLNHAEELIHKMVDLKILKEYEGKGIGFTSQFNRHSTKVCNRLDADPETQSFDISEGMRSVLLNYFKPGVKVSDYELYDMGLMVYTLKMMNAGRDPTNIP